jgi:hypothetical protein
MLVPILLLLTTLLAAYFYVQSMATHSIFPAAPTFTSQFDQQLANFLASQAPPQVAPPPDSQPPQVWQPAGDPAAPIDPSYGYQVEGPLPMASTRV